MRRPLKTTFLAAAIAAFVPVRALPDATAAPSPLFTLIRQKYNPERPFSAEFTLTIYWSVREKKETKRGSIALAPGDRFRVTAGKEEFVSNGTTCWHYRAAANQVTVKPVAGVDRSLFPSQIFATYIGACPFREIDRKAGIARFAWSTDSPGARYRTIEVWAGVKSGRITRCVMTDRNGNLFTYEFSKTVFGNKFSREAFEFAIPKNAQVIDESD